MADSVCSRSHVGILLNAALVPPVPAGGELTISSGLPTPMTRPGAVGLPSEMEPIQGPFYSRKSPNMPAAGSRPASAAACSGTPASRRLSSRRATPDGSSRAVWAVVEGGVGGGPGGQRGGLLVRPRPAGFPAGEPRRPVVPRYRP